ncbi:MAG: hypothetical protein WB608_16715 [Terracidiphilus sp.]
MLAPSRSLAAQVSPAERNSITPQEPPDAPQPQVDLSSGAPIGPQLSSARQENPQTGPEFAPAQESSSSPAPAPAQSGTDQAQREKAEQQIREQEKQRVLGVLPAFNTSYRRDAVSLTAKQKISLAFRSSIDPVTFGTAVLVAGYGEIADSDSGFPWGAKGFGERAGAKYLDAVDGTMIGNGFLPALLHQDPRYFRLGHGSKTHRLFYAISTSVICKHDNTGKWEPNYSNVGGNLISGALSTLYYPPNDSGIGLTIGNGLIVTAEGTIGGVFQEFWPDISRKLFHKDPTRGLDAEAKAADQAAKQAKQNAH